RQHIESVGHSGWNPEGIPGVLSNPTDQFCLQCELKGHLMDVNKCRFFPSNEVVLSAGADMRIKIWSAIDASCPATLSGHRGAVNDLAIIDRGRNVVSV